MHRIEADRDGITCVTIAVVGIAHVFSTNLGLTGVRKTHRAEIFKTVTTHTQAVRRIKCDEGRPECVKCTSTGRKCDGYLRGNPGAGNVHRRPSGADLFVSPLAVTPSLHDLGSEQERRSFHFFCSRTIIRLSGYFVAGFWNRWVLQAFHHEPAIRHAVIALGSIHERFDGGDVAVLGSNRDTSRGGFALEQYNHAIRHLLEPATQGTRPAFDVCLISCVLFACFEV